MRRGTGNSFDAVLFDLDGTLLDTEAIMIVTGLEAFAAHGITIEPAFLHRLAGVDDETGFRQIQAAFPRVDVATLDRDWTAARHRRQVEVGIPLKPGAMELLDMITLPMALVTSSPRAAATRKLGLTGLAGRFAAVVTFDDVSRPKPDPEPYLMGARLLGMDPRRCAVFEDSETGAAAGRAAGCFVVQVPDLMPATGTHADVVATDLLSGARAAGLIAG